MAGFLGALEYVLEEGPSKDWLEYAPVAASAAICAVSCLAFFWRALTARQPIVDLTAFRDRNFWSGSLFSFAMGVGLYGLTYIYPVYLSRVRGFSALQIGETMFLTGVCMFLTAPVAGRLTTKIDPRFMMAAGFAGFALGTWQAHYVTKDWQFYELIIPQVLRGVCLMFIMIPITNLSLGTLPPERIKNASGLFNLTRNLGGAFGLALINTILNKRLDLHLARLHEQVNWASTSANETLANMTRAYSELGSDANMAALKKLSGLVRREATVLALSDVFLVLTALFLFCLLLMPLLQKPSAAASGADAH